MAESNFIVVEKVRTWVNEISFLSGNSLCEQEDSVRRDIKGQKSYDMNIPLGKEYWHQVLRYLVPVPPYLVPGSVPGTRYQVRTTW